MSGRRWLGSRGAVVVGVTFAAVLLVGLFVFAVLRTPGSHIDESSIGLNAWSIATRGVDEHGEPWPVFFKAFGEWKNPIYIYLLAGVFRFTGPSMAAARLTSGILVLLTAAAAAALGARLGGKTAAVSGLLLSLSYPWWFDIGRLVFEVAVYPLTAVVFLLAAHVVWRNPRSVPGAILLALGLIGLSYGYSTGRLVAPVSGALVAVLLARREGRWNFATIGGLLGWILGLVPLAWFVMRHPRALTNRFERIADVPNNPLFDPLVLFWRALLELNPLYWIHAGERSDLQTHHVVGHAAVTLGMAALALYGAFRMLAHVRDRWGLFVLAFTVLGVVPSILTYGRHHQLRLATFAAGVLVLAVAGAAELVNSRGGRAVALPVALAVVQGLLYLAVAARVGPTLAHTFNVDLLSAVAHASADPDDEFWIVDRYRGIKHGAHLRWWALLHGVPDSRIHRTLGEPPPGAVELSGPSGRVYKQVYVVRKGG